MHDESFLAANAESTAEFLFECTAVKFTWGDQQIAADDMLHQHHSNDRLVAKIVRRLNKYPGTCGNSQ